MRLFLDPRTLRGVEKVKSRDFHFAVTTVTPTVTTVTTVTVSFAAPVRAAKSGPAAKEV